MAKIESTFEVEDSHKNSVTLDIQPVKEELNYWQRLSIRKRAIIQMNLFAFTCTIYQACAKVATKEEKVDVIDLCLARTFINLCFAIVILNISGKHIINDVPKESRKFILIRCCFGTVGFTTLVYSVKILPLFIV